MPVKPDLSGLDLDTLLALQNDVQSRIEALLGHDTREGAGAPADTP